ncbi:TPA: hypothetical protein CPT80_00375 [Candidatus Gastranaerophilales bacterium HUM_9]|nr:MAG TPA: hypothetical protein CPT80_00375 [Candidatus Gastranaerophilales bacterium HUM_9]HBX35500.1 hypothetical protein [Cyanobacteria bacterium UBA11440]
MFGISTKKPFNFEFFNSIRNPIKHTKKNGTEYIGKNIHNVIGNAFVKYVSMLKTGMSIISKSSI